MLLENRSIHDLARTELRQGLFKKGGKAAGIAQNRIVEKVDRQSNENDTVLSVDDTNIGRAVVALR